MRRVPRSVRLRVAFVLFLLGPLVGSPIAWAAAPDPALGRRGMVVTSQAEATRAGLRMLTAGAHA